MLRFFEQTSYVEILRGYISENLNVRGYQSLLAKAAGCHTSHLSHVLSGRAHLNLEQAVAVCAFWSLNEIHSDYFIALVNLSRAGTSLLREKFERDLVKIRTDSLRGVSTQASRALVVTLNPEQSLYYLSAWYISAIHAALDIEGLQTIEALAMRFRLSLELVATVLTNLEEFGLAKSHEGKWLGETYTELGGDPKSVTKVYHHVIRQKANECQETRKETDYFPTNLLTVPRSALPEIKARLQNIVRSILEDHQECEQEELVFFGVDFFVP